MEKNMNNLLSKMTVGDKAALCSGENYWRLRANSSLDIPSVTVCDGPYGLVKKKIKSQNISLEKGKPATCFPAPSALACSWDRELIEKIGVAVGEECQQENVAMILSPAINIKRTPLCGRNHEYFSEDPFLTGELASSYINGIQSQGVGACVKHFAGYNQETNRMTVNSIIDERALREIYLSAFESVIKKSAPWALMTSYNKVNGDYTSENAHLLSDILRKEWGYDGVTVSDWGGVNNRVDALKAGLDLEMPGPTRYNTEQIVKAVADGELSEDALNSAVSRILNLIVTAVNNKKNHFLYNKEAHNALARKGAIRSAVLLKNDDNILPISKTAQIAVIGDFAKHPVISGGGSSEVNPIRVSCAYDELFVQEISFAYADGYNPLDDNPREELIADAVKKAKNAEVVVIYAGLAFGSENEGFDRTSLNLPESQNKLISEVAKVNSNIVVVLHGGAPLAMPWIDDVRAVLMMGLSGQSGSAASIDLLFGNKSPSGKLAETYPITATDAPATQYISPNSNTSVYRDSLFVGYRYYNSAKKEVLFPFGHGLSYTKFKYSRLRISKNYIDENEEITVSFNVKNIGDVECAEIAQLYIAKKNSVVIRPELELREFARVFLQPNEEQEVTFKLDKSAFAFFNVKTNSYEVESGIYSIKIGSSSQNILLEIDAKVNSTKKDLVYPDYREMCPSYYDLKGHSHFISSASEFEKFSGIYTGEDGYSINKIYSLNSTLNELCDNKTVAPLIKTMLKKSDQITAGTTPSVQAMVSAQAGNMPIRAVASLSAGKFSHKSALGIVKMANGQKISGFLKFIGGIISK